MEVVDLYEEPEDLFRNALGDVSEADKDEFARLLLLTQVAKRHRLQRDAEHLTQAICNNCEYFLTRDEKSIIRPYKQKIEERFASLKIRLPSELVEEFRASGILIDSSAAPSRE